MLPLKLGAGTGPAALIVGGVVFLAYLQNPVGWILIGLGIALSLIWKFKFS